jgi:ribosomal-protein-alanine N-acetyltransferase
VNPSCALKLCQDISLVQVTLEHAANMARWMEDPIISHNLGLRSTPSLEKTIIWIENALQSQDIYPFAILYKGQHVGNVIVDRIDRYLETGRLSIYIGEESARGIGAGLTGIYLALDQCFNTLGLHKVWITVHTRNFPSIRTFTRLGFSLEGILREEFYLDGERLSVFYMGLLRDEFLHLKIDPAENL